jgi:hypothetical protein
LVLLLLLLLLLALLQAKFEARCQQAHRTKSRQSQPYKCDNTFLLN